MARNDDEERLYLWVRIVGFGVLLGTVVLTVMAVVFLPLLHVDYEVDSATIIAIVGTLTASALALVEVTVRIRRNGFKDTEGGDDDH